MRYTPLSPELRERLAANCAALGRRWPALPPAAERCAERLEFAFGGGDIAAVRARAAGGFAEILPPGAGADLERQRNAIHAALNENTRLAVLSGIGAGRALGFLAEALSRNPDAAACAIEPDPMHLAACLCLFDIEPVIGDERLRLCIGPEAADQFETAAAEQCWHLIPAAQTRYLLGCAPGNAGDAARYSQLGRRCAQTLADAFGRFERKLDVMLSRPPLSPASPPRRVWSVMNPRAYIHYPILRALLAGFEQNGMESRLHDWSGAAHEIQRAAGGLAEFEPDMAVFMNANPREAMMSLGFRETFLERFNRPRASMLFDNPNFYQDDYFEHPPGPNDWFFCIDRAYLNWLPGANAACLPAATMLDGPGTRREEHRARISYVGSLPDVGDVWNQLGEADRQRVRGFSVLKWNAPETPWSRFVEESVTDRAFAQRFGEWAEAFHAKSGKALTLPGKRLEYFLYAMATFVKRLDTVASLLPLGLAVYGPETWRDALPPEYRDRYRGFVRRGELADVYASADLSLNIHSHQCPTALNPRDFDVPMAGGAAMGDRVAAMDEGLLVPGREIIAHDRLEDAADTAADWLSRPGDLDELRARGMERVRNEHTYRNRAAAILARMDFAPDP